MSAGGSPAPVGLPGEHRYSSWQSSHVCAVTTSEIGQVNRFVCASDEVRRGTGQQSSTFVDLVEQIGRHHQRRTATVDDGLGNENSASRVPFTGNTWRSGSIVCGGNVKRWHSQSPIASRSAGMPLVSG